MSTPPIDVAAWRVEVDKIGAGAPPEPTASKVAGLEETVKRFVKPGDGLYFGGSLCRPNAALFSVVRQFWGTEPRFTVITPALGNQFVPLVHGALVSKAITTMHATVYPAPGPNRIYAGADESGAVDFEDWSLLTLVQRLMAGAFGLPFWPTNSIVDSDLEKDLTARGLFGRTSSPFDSASAGVVAPLNPDVTFIHGALADHYGNTVIPAPWYDDVWAARATKGSVIVTVERIVPTEVIRRHSGLVRLTAPFVTAVCEAPLGGHPTQVAAHGVTEIDGYGDDYELLRAIADASRDDARLDEWIREWILDVDDHDAYVAKLGPERIAALRGGISPDSWLFERAEKAQSVERPTGNGDLLAALGARQVHELALEFDTRVLLAGVGAATIAAWLGARLLAEVGVAVDLVNESGLLGMTPRPLDPFLFSARNIPGTNSLSDLFTTLGATVGGAVAQSMAVLGAGQVDRHGRINSSRVKGRLLTGSGGGNDVASTAKCVIVTAPHAPNRLVAEVDWVTSPSTNVAMIVTDRGVLRRADASAPFRLTGVLDRDGATRDELITQAVELCGWDLEVAADVVLFPAITATEIARVRAFDPAGHF